MLLECHEYTPVYQQAYEILHGYDIHEDVSVTLRLKPGMDHRRYNLPTVSELAVLIPNAEDSLPRDIVLRRRDRRGLDRISELHPGYVPLQYPLLLPHGTLQWHPNIYLTESEDQLSLRSQQGRRRRAEHRERDGDDDGEDEDEASDRTVTLSRYVAYCIHYRRGEFNTFLRAG
jgi:hypothetical protein